MTDDTNNIDIDARQLKGYIKQYRATTDRKKQREIENQVLAETVWKEPQNQEPELTLGKSQIEVLYSALPDDAEEARRILRSIHLDDL